MTDMVTRSLTSSSTGTLCLHHLHCSCIHRSVDPAKSNDNVINNLAGTPTIFLQRCRPHTSATLPPCTVRYHPHRIHFPVDTRSLAKQLFVTENAYLPRCIRTYNGHLRKYCLATLVATARNTIAANGRDMMTLSLLMLVVKETQTDIPQQNKIWGWDCTRILNGGLEIQSTPSSDQSWKYCDIPDDQPRYILLPGMDAININTNGI